MNQETQQVEQAKTKYVKGEKCPNCGRGWIINHGDFLECEDCGCEVNAKCDNCHTPLKRDGNDHICCADCGGWDGYSIRQNARFEIVQAEHALKKAKEHLVNVCEETRG